MEYPLISLGLLAYNHEKYIADALEGILSQTYPSLELIILDDASTDNTVQIIERYMQRLQDKFRRVLFIKNEQNCGNIPKNCNRIIDEIKGEFYFECSGDDILLPNAVAILQEQLVEHPSCIAIHANAIFIDDAFHFGDEVVNNSLIHDNRATQIESETLFKRMMYYNRIVTPTVMLYSKVFQKYGNHDENIKFEDYEYWLRLSQKEKFLYLDKPVLLYRRHEESYTTHEGKDGAQKTRIAIEADYAAKKKYIDKLSLEEQSQCWNFYHEIYEQQCEQYGYGDELKLLLKLMQKENVVLSKPKSIYHRLKRQRLENDIIEKWLNIKDKQRVLGAYFESWGVSTIAVYGYSRLGKILLRELAKDGITTDYIIDKQGEMLEAPLPVYTLNDSLPKVDAIIVAPPGLIRIVKQSLTDKIFTNIFDLECVINDIATSVNRERN